MKILSMFFLLLISLQAFGQQVKLNGHIVGQNNKAVDYAEILLYNDSLLIGSTITDAQGFFNITTHKGCHNLVIKSFGNILYSQILEVNDHVVLDNIKIDNSISLKGVVISANKKLIERKIDRLVLNVENNAFAQGMNITELLSLTPMLNVTEQSIGIVGKNSISVFINNKKVLMRGIDLINFLATQRADNVSKVEVITTPPSKYEAEGNGGIVNIIFKKSPTMGWSGVLGATWIQRSSFSGGANGILNYGTNKLQVTAMLNIITQKKNTSSYSKYDFTDKIGNREELAMNNAASFPIAAEIKLNYDISPKSSIGIITDYTSVRADAKSEYVTIFDNQLENSKLKNNNFNDLDYSNYIINIYNDNKIGNKGYLLSVSGTYLYKESTNTLAIHYPDKSLLTASRQKYDVITGQADFTLPFKILNLETGLKYSKYKNTSNTSYFQGETSYFVYDEDNYAAYLSADKKISEKWMVKAGLRYEFTHLTTNAGREKSNYGDFFPTIYGSYHLNKSNIFSLNYSRRIERPTSVQLDPFRNYSSEYSYREGNPYLNPYYSNNLELNYGYKDNLNFRLYATFLKDKISDYIYIQEDTVVNTFGNIYSSNSFGFEVNYSFKLFKIASNYVSWNTYYNKTFSPKNVATTKEGWNNYIYINSQVALNKKKSLSLNLSYWEYFPRTEYNEQWKSRGRFDIGMKAFLLKKSMQLSLQITDVFNQDNVHLTSYLNNCNKEIKNTFENRSFRLSISYLFGNKRVQGSRKKLYFHEQNRLVE